MAMIKIEELNAVSELTSAELSLTKGGHHDCCGSLVVLNDVDGIDNYWGYFTINDEGIVNVLGVVSEVEDSGNGNVIIF